MPNSPITDPHVKAINNAMQMRTQPVAQSTKSTPERSIPDRIAQAAYLPAFNKGFNDLVVKPMAGAADFLNRTIDKAYQGVTGDHAPEWLVPKEGLFSKVSDTLDKAYNTRDKPKNIASDIGENLVGTLPLMASLFTGEGEASLAAKAPQFVSKATKLLATTGAANAYKDATDNKEGYGESLKSAAGGASKGALQGATMDAQMLLGGALGKGTANKLAEYGLMKGGKAGEALIHALATGTIFGGTSAGEDLLNGKDIDPHEAAKQFGTGLAFEMIPVAKGISDEVGGKVINGKAANLAATTSAASNLNSESVLRTLMNTPKEQIEAIHNNVSENHEDLWAKSIEQGAKAYEETDPSEKRNAYANQMLLKTQGDLKYVATKDHTELTDAIENSPELQPEQKSDLLDKLNILKNPTENEKNDQQQENNSPENRKGGDEDADKSSESPEKGVQGSGQLLKSEGGDELPKRNRVPDKDAPTVEELKTNLPEKGKAGISIENATKRRHGSGELTDEPLDNGTKHIVSRGEDGKVNGVLEIATDEKGKPTSVKVAVEPSERRKGIATALFKHAEDNGIDLSEVRGKETTDAGQALLETNNKSKENAVQKSETKGVSVQSEAQNSEGVPKGNTKGEEIASEGEETQKQVKKTILTQRAYEGEIQPEVKKHLEEKGLNRSSFSHEQRSKQASDFIDKFGDEAAFHAVKSGDVDGGLAASILTQLQIKNNHDIEDASPEDVEALSKKQADYIELLEKKGYLGGEFNGQLRHEYQNAELNYANVKRQVERSTNKPTTPEQEKKIKELTDTANKLKKQVEDAEAKLIEETDKAFEAGKESAKDETKAQKAKRIANKIRAGKIHKSTLFSSASPASLAWDTAVELTAKTVEAGGKLADAIEAGVKHIKSTDWYKNLSDKNKKQAEDEFRNHLKSNSGSTDLEDLQDRFVDKKDNKFTPDEAKDIWKYMRENYINNGTSYRDAIAKTSEDLGLSWRQVSEAIITPKLKRTSDEMWKKQADLARNRTVVKDWVADQNKSKAWKALQKTSGLFRGVAVFGHGGIFIGTHAGMTLFDLPNTTKTVKAFLNGWKFAYGNEANYEKAMEELQHSPNYVIAQRAGLNNNPERMNAEEYQRSQKYLGKLGIAGEKGFNAIKILRQDLFDHYYNQLSAAERDDPATLQSIAKLMNLATGATNLKLPKWVNEVTFAGGMEASRWGKLTRSPLKATEVAIKAITNPDKVSTADKVFAKVWAKRVGTELATFTGALLANAALQSQLNPKNPVNLTNPNKSDYLKFKAGELTIDPTSGMLGVTSFMHRIGEIPIESQKELHGDKRMNAIGKDAIGYARGKLSPLYGTIADVVTHQDYGGNTLPWNSDKPSKGSHKLSYPEYAGSKLPLPIAEALNVAYKSATDHGAKNPTLKDAMNGLISGAISGTTGFRVSEQKKKGLSKYIP